MINLLDSIDDNKEAESNNDSAEDDSNNKETQNQKESASLRQMCMDVAATTLPATRGSLKAKALAVRAAGDENAKRQNQKILASSGSAPSRPSHTSSSRMKMTILGPCLSTRQGCHKICTTKLHGSCSFHAINNETSKDELVEMRNKFRDELLADGSMDDDHDMIEKICAWDD